MSILALIRLSVFEKFPSKGTTIKDLAQQVDRNENIVRRLMSHAASYHVFFQAKPDFFVHTAGSRILTENEGMRSWILVGLGETMPGALKVCYIQTKLQFTSS
jgi:hypothetical protein